MARIDATITDDVHRWLKKEAARGPLSLSQVIARVLEKEMRLEEFARREDSAEGREGCGKRWLKEVR